MSRPIKPTEDFIKDILEKLEKELRETKSDSGKLSISKEYGEIDRRATLEFSETAWLKMQGLVKQWDKEIGWHGIAYRKGRDEYKIEDILIYPQVVTSVTVTSDQTKYQEWLYSHEDEVFNNIRMQGHSHVNMGVSPSTTDTALYKEILDMLSQSMFYIFLIWNKKNERTIKIYDMRENILFETKDVDVVIESEFGIQKFINESIAMVKEETEQASKKKESDKKEEFDKDWENRKEKKILLGDYDWRKYYD